MIRVRLVPYRSVGYAVPKRSRYTTADDFGAADEVAVGAISSLSEA